jgi:hypothetical protein
MDATNSLLSEKDSNARNVPISIFVLLATKKKNTNMNSELWKNLNVLSDSEKETKNGVRKTKDVEKKLKKK